MTVRDDANAIDTRKLLRVSETFPDQARQAERSVHVATLRVLQGRAFR